MRKIALLILFVSAINICAQHKSYNVPLLNNTYIDDGTVSKNNVVINKNGLVFENNTSNTATTYFYLTKGVQSRLSLNAKGHGTIEVTVENVSPKSTTKKVKINSDEFKNYDLGSFTTTKDAYIRIKYQLLKFLNVIDIKYINVASEKNPIFLSEDFNTHFGLRGPSCHLAYNTKAYGNKIEWAMLDVTVPEELDKIGSYYMALGFSAGYFGFQNNSKDRRQVLFSVWNSVDDDNPDNVAEEHRTQVIAHGENVTAQNFGHEGSGKQTFLALDWKPNTTYRFLLHATKVDSLTTDFSAWFYDTPHDNWIYMATLRRPNTPEMLRGLHSFLENFSPAQGDKTRKAYYYNVWVKPVNDDWKPVSTATLTNDLTGSKGVRLDFNGGVEDNKFFLINGGYFDRPETINRALRLKSFSKQPPSIDLNKILNTQK